MSYTHTHTHTHMHTHTYTYTHVHIYTHTNMCKNTHKYNRQKNLCSTSSSPSFSVVEEGKADVLVLGSTLDDAVTGIIIERDGTDDLVDGTDDRANDDEINGTSTGDVSDADTDVDDGNDGDDGDDGNDAGGVGRSSMAIIEHTLIK